MKNTLLIALAAVLLIGAVVIISMVPKDPANPNANTENTAEKDSTGAGAGYPEYVKGANLGDIVDATGKEEVEIVINDNIFEQTVVTISKDTTVTWVNEGRIRHNVVSDSSSPKQGLNSELLTNGQTFSYTFDQTGTYNYYCQPHPFDMKAVIEVVE